MVVVVKKKKEKIVRRTRKRRGDKKKKRNSPPPSSYITGCCCVCNGVYNFNPFLFSFYMNIERKENLTFWYFKNRKKKATTPFLLLISPLLTGLFRLWRSFNFLLFFCVHFDGLSGWYDGRASKEPQQQSFLFLYYVYDVCRRNQGVNREPYTDGEWGVQQTTTKKKRL